MWTSIAILPLIGIIAVGVAWAVLAIMKSKADPVPHPAELSSQSRAALRPLREAVEGFEQAVSSNKSIEASQILGNQARDSVRKTLAEATKMMANRDVLYGLAQRLNNQGSDASPPQEAIKRIDQNLSEAAQAIDQLTLKITQAAISAQSEIPDLESDLPDLINRLQNVSKSFDEVNQNLDQSELS